MRLIKSLRKQVSIFILLLISPILISKCHAKELVTIKYGTQVQKVSPNFKEGTFFAEFYWWMIITNDSVKTGYKLDDILNIQYVNAYGISPSGVKKEIQEIKYRGNNEYYIVGLHQGTFLFYPDYKKYPFDVQVLPIKVDNANIPNDELIFIVDTNSYYKSGQDRNLWSISTELKNMKSVIYKIKSAHATVINGEYNTDFGDINFPPISSMSRYVNNIYIDRSFLPFISKLIIPLIFILCLTYMVFYIEADKFDSARGLSVTSMFSSFAFQITATKDLPDVGYVIYVDKVFYLVYMLIAISLVFVIIRYNLDKTKQIRIDESNSIELKISKMNIYGRILFPIIFFGGAYALSL